MGVSFGQVYRQARGNKTITPVMGSGLARKARAAGLAGRVAFGLRTRTWMLRAQPVPDPLPCLAATNLGSKAVYGEFQQMQARSSLES